MSRDFPEVRSGVGGLPHHPRRLGALLAPTWDGRERRAPRRPDKEALHVAFTAKIEERPVRLTTYGLVAGAAAAAVMIVYAMVAAATYQDTGFFTPLYHIASTFIDPAAMKASMEAAMGGDSFYFDAGPAALGLGIHLGTGAVWGAVFGFLLGALRSSRLAAVPLGLGYSMVVLVLMSFVVLPVAAELFGGGQPISEMPDMVGWATFGVEHLIFGLVLGLFWPLLPPRPVDAPRHAAASFAR